VLRFWSNIFCASAENRWTGFREIHQPSYKPCKVKDLAGLWV
jgi:hypothetical protein